MKKIVIILSIIALSSVNVFSQSQPKIGPNGIAVPLFTETNRLAISSPETGLIVYQTDATVGYYSYNGSSWERLMSGSTDYLPLSGGTLTGGLSGTTASFSGNLIASGELTTIGSNGGASTDTRFYVKGGRESEGIKFDFPGGTYNNVLSLNWYSTAWKLRTERSGGDITDLSFARFDGTTDTEYMKLSQSGNLSVTGTMTSGGAITGTSFVKSGGTSSQFLKADGSVDANTYLSSSSTLPVSSGGSGLTTISNGSILFGDGTNPIGTSSNLFWDNTNSRLGLLTQSPSTTFQIGNDNSAENLKWGIMSGENTLQLGYRQTGWKMKANNNSGVITDLLFSRNDGTSDTDIMSLGQYSGVTVYPVLNAQTSVTSPLGNFTSLNINNGQIYYNNADDKVGIFTQSPTSKFQVYGDGGFDYPLKYDNVNNSGILKFGFRSKEFRLTSTSDSGVLNRLSFKYFDGTSENESMYLDNNGNVGITNLIVNSVSKSGGTSSQFLKADGSVDANTYLQSSDISSSYLSLSGGTLTGGLNGTTASFSSDATVNTLTVGLGNSAISTNSAIGYHALNSNTTGDINTAVGYSSLESNTDGFYNTALGTNTLKLNTGGARNTAIGGQALYNNNGNDNTALGYLGLLNNTSGSFNVGIGSQSLFSNTSGGYNTASGSLALQSNLTGSNNTASGYLSLSSNTTGGGNTAAGSSSLPSNTSGTYNVAIGVQSLEQNTTGDQNTAIGTAAIDRNTTGSGNAVLGAFAGRYISDGLTFNTIINNSILIGSNTKPNADNESNQIVIGYNSTGIGSNTTVIGNSSTTAAAIYGDLLLGSTTDLGTYQLQVTGNSIFTGTLKVGDITIPNTDGTADQVLKTNGAGVLSWTTVSGGGGASSLDELSDVKVEGVNFTNSILIGSENTGVLIDAPDNVGIGKATFASITSGRRNSAFGNYTLTNLTSGRDNLALGFNALSANTVANGNVAIGSSALSTNETGTYNVAIGNSSLSSNISGSENVAIGNGADVGSDNLSNAIAIGSGAIVSASNTIQLGNTSVTDIKTSGNFYTLGSIRADANLRVVGETDFHDNININYWNNGEHSSELRFFTNNSGGDVHYSAFKAGFEQVEDITYTLPLSKGTANQVLTTDGSGTLSWSTVSKPLLTTVYGSGVTLSAANSGSIFYVDGNFSPLFPENLPDGFTCTIVNTSEDPYVSQSLLSTKFYSSSIGMGGDVFFTIPSGGSVNIYVLTTVGGVKRYFVK